jgi:hypothetical protein
MTSFQVLNYTYGGHHYKIRSRDCSGSVFSETMPSTMEFATTDLQEDPVWPACIAYRTIHMKPDASEIWLYGYGK